MVRRTRKLPGGNSIPRAAARGTAVGLEVRNLKEDSLHVTQPPSYEGPCGHNHPSSFWLYTDDFNHDGHKDFGLISVYDVTGKTGEPAYVKYIYSPGASTTMPFAQL